MTIDTYTPDRPPPEVAADGSASVRDGRQLRRLRNIEAVRAAILELYEQRASLDLETVAARAGVTVRSVYRYHADLDAAIQDALQSRIDHVFEVWRRQALPSPDEPLRARVERMLDHRLEIERLGRPLRNEVLMQSPDPEFDRQVLQVFAPEISGLPESDRANVSAMVCYLLRPRGLRALIEYPQHERLDPRQLVSHTLLRLLCDEAPSADSGSG